MNYFLGLLIIILYAKDKFNTPTYDKELMGPFSQLPPQFLTIDARYRQGVRTYIFLLLALYTALCIIGPYTFSQQTTWDRGRQRPALACRFGHLPDFHRRRKGQFGSGQDRALHPSICPEDGLHPEHRQ